MKLRHKLFIAFFTISLLALGTVSIISYINSKDAIEQQVLNHLRSVSKIQKGRLQQIFHMMLEELSGINSRTYLRKFLAAYNNESQPQQAQHEMNIILTDAKNSIENFRQIVVTNPRGIVVAATSSRFIGEDFSTKAVFKKGKEEKNISDFFLDESGELRVNTSAPLYYNNDFLGVVIIESLVDEVEALVEDYTGLGKTGETILARKTPEGDAVFIAPARFDTAAALQRVIPKEEVRNAIFTALARKEVVLKDALNYLQKPVFASTRYLPQYEIGLVSKIDKQEALAPILQLRSIMILVVFFTVIALAIIIIYISRRITGPVNSLTSAANKVMKGNFDARVSVKSQDELGLLSIAFNKMISSVRHTQAELKKRIEETKEVNEELKQFAYIVSHDLKAPLRAIDTLADFIIEDQSEKLDEEGKHQLGLLKSRVKRMENLINGILRYSRIGREKEKKQQVDLDKQVREVIESLEPPPHIDVSIEDKLPVLYIEAVPVMQVFMNLISNAIKYNDKPRGIVKIGCKDRETHWEFYVSDNGPGIKPKYQERIFRIFETGEARKGDDSTGIGLAIVKKIVDSYHCNVWLESTPGEGTTFYFTLPKSTKEPDKLD